MSTPRPPFAMARVIASGLQVNEADRQAGYEAGARGERLAAPPPGRDLFSFLVGLGAGRSFGSGSAHQ